MFCEEKLGKIKFRAFLERVGPRILSLENVDYLGTSEHFSGGKKIRILISKISLVSVLFVLYMQMSRVMSVRLIFGDD